MTISSIEPTINTVLNPKIWEGGNRMNSAVRGALMRIAQDFKKFVDIDFPVEDLIVTGSNANYNYNTHSDIDLHLITDFEQLDCDRTAQELFDTKRLLYKKEYRVVIHGIPVELYVEDKNHPGISGGSYSVLSGKWLSTPNPDIEQPDRTQLNHMIAVWHTILTHAMQTGSLNVCRHAVELLRKYRKMGLQATAQAEFSIPNLVYKSLRNDKTLENITNMIDRLHDQSLSLPD
jgi:hypothetical protein